MKEKTIRDRFIRRIRNLPEPSWARVLTAGAAGASVNQGEPDIDACVDGISLKVEVKVPGNNYGLTKLQALSIRRWRAAGAVAGEARTDEDLDALIEECRMRRRG